MKKTMSESTLLRQWKLMQDQLVPGLVQVHQTRDPVTWSTGRAGDAVALVLAYEQATRGNTDLRAFASEISARLHPLSFGPADMREIPISSREESFSRRERRWVPHRAVTDRVLLSHPTQAVDLLTIRAERRAATDIVARCSDRLRPGGQLLVLDPRLDEDEQLCGFVGTFGREAGYRLYRKSAGAGSTEQSLRPRPAAAGEPQPTIASRSSEDDLVLTHLRLAQSLARPFTHHGESANDLEQVAFVALVKAVRRFDPSLNVTFATFATSTIQGELKRHFRDKTCSMRVPRRLQETYLAVKATRDELSHQLRATPSVSHIARHLGTSEEAVLEAMEAGEAYWPEAPTAGFADNDPNIDIPVEDGGYERALELQELQRILPRLDHRERLVVGRAYVGRCTPEAVAHQLGVSQIEVSQILSGAIDKMRRWAREQ
jgi:RNA polymerase sigma-B factor